MATPRPRNGEVVQPEAGSYDPSGLRPRLRGSLTVTGAGGASLLLDGLVIEGTSWSDRERSAR